MDHMRILTGYDGSDCSNVAIDDLARAGLGDDVEARVMTVADVYPHVPDSFFEPAGRDQLAQMTPVVRRAHELAMAAMSEAKETAAQGAQRAASRFPRWKVEPMSCAGTPATSLVGEANTWGADLIVIGSHGRGAFGRALMRIVLGLDGSPNAAAALNAVALRKWPAGTEVRAVVALDVRLATVLPTMTHEFPWPAPTDRESQDWPRHAAESAVKELERAGLKAAPVVRDGDPKRVLIEESDQWPADCIVVGARGLSRIEGILLGSVSSSVAARARCSVEVVRFE
jgi:nucleotide-binding universal stress UspA family protein